MSQIDASDFSSLKGTVEAKSNEELVSAIQQQEGGVDGVLDKVFAGMSESFNPDKAAGQQAVVQYEISAPDGTHEYAMRIADGRCEIERGRAESPRVTVRIGHRRLPAPDHRRGQRHAAVHDRQAQGLGRPVLRPDLPVLVRPASGLRRPGRLGDGSVHHQEPVAALLA